jgi:hypothetical protein
MGWIQKLEHNKWQAIKRNEYVAAAHTKFRDNLVTVSEVFKWTDTHASARIWCGSSDKRNAGFLQILALRSRYVTRWSEYRRWRCSSTKTAYDSHLRGFHSDSTFNCTDSLTQRYTQLLKKWKRLKCNKGLTSRRWILITAKIKDLKS